MRPSVGQGETNMAEDTPDVNPPAPRQPEPAPPYAPIPAPGAPAPAAPAYEEPDGVGWDLPVPTAIPEAELRCQICGSDTHTTEEHPG